MQGVDWAQRVADARIARQLEHADGLDTKAGLIFAYGTALLIGAPTIGTGGQLSVSLFLCTLVLGVGTVILATIVLYPRGFNDPPNAKRFTDEISEEIVSLDWARRRLMKDQIIATEYNGHVIDWKVAGMKAAIAFMTAGGTTLFLQVMAKEGYIGG